MMWPKSIRVQNTGPSTVQCRPLSQDYFAQKLRAGVIPSEGGINANPTNPTFALSLHQNIVAGHKPIAVCGTTAGSGKKACLKLYLKAEAIKTRDP